MKTRRTQRGASHSTHLLGEMEAKLEGFIEEQYKLVVV
jgi:hypothetical protein